MLMILLSYCMLAIHVLYIICKLYIKIAYDTRTVYHMLQYNMLEFTVSWATFHERYFVYKTQILIYPHNLESWNMNTILYLKGAGRLEICSGMNTLPPPPSKHWAIIFFMAFSCRNPIDPLMRCAWYFLVYFSCSQLFLVFVNKVVRPSPWSDRPLKKGRMSRAGGGLYLKTMDIYSKERR